MANGGIIGPTQTVGQNYDKDKVTAITASGCFNKATANPAAPGNATVITVAGGGGSGGDAGGAGGAGGMLITACHPLPGSAVPVTIGAGGSGGSHPPGSGTTNGSNSVFGSSTPLTATGGGRGGQASQRCGQPGGSGGGGMEWNPATPTGGACGFGNGTACQGNAGGPAGPSGTGGAGAGGGKTSTGAEGYTGDHPVPVPSLAGAGFDIFPYVANAATPYTVPNCGVYAGGGNGRPGNNVFRSPGGGGVCGSISPNPNPNRSGIANTGGGAGAGPGNNPGGSGGTGVVIVVEECQALGSKAAPGIWSMNEVYEQVKQNDWVTGSTFIAATGGNTTTTSGDYKIHTFTASGPFNVTSAAANVPTADSMVDYLIVAGGGSSGNGNGNAPGGGGAGGVRFSARTFSMGCAPAAPRGQGVCGVTVTVQDYPVVVGAGDAGQTGPQPNPGTRRGTDSSALGITSTGGGAGGYHSGGGGPGNSGGSGGGASGGGLSKCRGEASPNTAVPMQGSPGGYRPGTPPDGGGGSGGGMMFSGVNAGPAIAAGGAGGGFPNAFGTSGVPCGSFYYFAGGGASDGVTSGCTPAPQANVGGIGGGGGIGQACGAVGVAGTANTGGGGGGPNNGPYSVSSASGGSGIVVLRYKFQ
jgi:hypothetical protein